MEPSKVEKWFDSGNNRFVGINFRSQIFRNANNPEMYLMMKPLHNEDIFIDYDVTLFNDLWV